MTLLVILQVKAWLADENDVRLGDWKAADIEILNTFQLLSAKPVVYLVGVPSILLFNFLLLYCVIPY